MQLAGVRYWVVERHKVSINIRLSVEIQALHFQSSGLVQSELTDCLVNDIVKHLDVGLRIGLVVQFPPVLKRTLVNLPDGRVHCACRVRRINKHTQLIAALNLQIGLLHAGRIN